MRATVPFCAWPFCCGCPAWSAACDCFKAAIRCASVWNCGSSASPIVVYVVGLYFVVRFLSGVEHVLVNECRVRRAVAHQARVLMFTSSM